MIETQQLQYFSQQIKGIREQLPPSCQLLAITKTKSIEYIQAGLDISQFDFGENRVEELAQKAAQIENQAVRWHFVGQLQSKKVGKLLQIPHLWAIHSVDRESLVNELIKKSDRWKSQQKLKLFLQFNTSGESQKAGFNSFKEVIFSLEKLLEHPKFEVSGLMTMSRLRTENFERDCHACFSSLVAIKQQVADKFDLNSLQLSMGMSADYPIALEYGSHWVRIGSQLFRS